MKTLLDTNIVLDVALKRPRFYNDAANIFKKIHEGKVQAFVSATTISVVFYILQKQSAKEKALQFLSRLVQVVDVAGIDKEIIIEALVSGWNDFEDALQDCAAQKNNIEVIVTRNTKDYTQSKIKIFTPSEFLKHLK
jgi:predicted nucleic acid-binding protein